MVVLQRYLHRIALPLMVHLQRRASATYSELGGVNGIYSFFTSHYWFFSSHNSSPILLSSFDGHDIIRQYFGIVYQPEISGPGRDGFVIVWL
jgi:hypothetical protein